MTRFVPLAAVAATLLLPGAAFAQVPKQAAPASPSSGDASVGTPAPPASTMNGEATSPEEGRTSGAANGGGHENHNPGKSPLNAGQP